MRPVDEAVPGGMSPELVAEHLALKKAMSFNDLSSQCIILTADTIVVSGGRILGKPLNRGEAIDMLQALSGRTHEVITGISLFHGLEPVVAHETTEVTFANMSQREMEYYVDQYRPMDKAGGYGIQEWIGMACISGIKGDFYNVMGLPTRKVWEEMQPFIVW